ncbi:Calcyclin-binding protein [Portunus trituberculatus]|uniref:Calcyclin-binding protein n=1 Tax=Portunus trituberculatus TaxID=210409 RepID=A0A5B7K1X8_PORTR|nr:Calcyclin-binding protein [Portunus trituberculatus]
MVVVLMAKAENGTKWSGVTAEDAKANEARKPKTDSSDPNAGIMDLMKQMYDDGDDKMKQVGDQFVIISSSFFYRLSSLLFIS